MRYRQREQWAVVTQTDTDALFVEFDEPQRAITKGQAVVLYDGEMVVGGGTICSVE
ncbi:aminomethyltransferase beta-barrel domain-containing protein [Hominifimenecus sp. rT4P-3]|uniref:aminomethyltransferase beta-barrel domain-containing protein n=1 Tax=Hominifimenecus sp. rT4P-3 TaxID=3242979 RepID=UPI003DA65067